MGKIVGLGNIRTKGEITIPVEVRKILGVKPGDKIILIQEQDQIVIKSAKEMEM